MNALVSLRNLSTQELSSVAGGVDTVTFYDNDRNGTLSEGDTVLYYTVNGYDISPGLYDALSGSSATYFSNFGSAIDYTLANPFEVFGLFIDNIDNVAPQPDYFYGFQPVYMSDYGP